MSAASPSRPSPFGSTVKRRRNIYHLNLIDTPGHVDFTYGVSRSVEDCEGALLLANTYLALHHNLEIIPVINKIELPSAEPERIRGQIEQVIGLSGSGCSPSRRQERRPIAAMSARSRVVVAGDAPVIVA